MNDYLYFDDDTAEAVESLDNLANDERMHNRGAVAVYWRWRSSAMGEVWVRRVRGLVTNRVIDEQEVPTAVKMLHLVAGG